MLLGEPDDRWAVIRRGAGGRAVEERAGKGAVEGPVSSERPCQRGWRREEGESSATPAGPAHILGGQSRRAACPLSPTRPQQTGRHSQSSPTPRQPGLPQAVCSPPALPAHRPLHACVPPPVLSLCLRPRPFFLRPTPCKAGFHTSLQAW